MAKKISDLLSAINYHEGTSLDKDELIAYILKNYPKAKISETRPWLSYVSNEIAREILSHFTNITEPFMDLQEHLFLKFPHNGRFVMPSDVINERGEWFDVITSIFGTTDLCNYKNKMLSECSLRDYADYLIKRHKAKEITFEEFKQIGLGGEIAVDKRESPIPLFKREDIRR